MSCGRPKFSLSVETRKLSRVGRNGRVVDQEECETTGSKGVREGFGGSKVTRKFGLDGSRFTTSVKK